MLTPGGSLYCFAMLPECAVLLTYEIMVTVFTKTTQAHLWFTDIFAIKSVQMPHLAM